MFDMRCVARQPVELVNPKSPLPLRSVKNHAGIEGGQRYRHIARISSDAMVACAEDRKSPALTQHCGASGIGCPLVAFRVARVVEIGTPRTLKQIATGGRHIAN